MKGRIEVVRGKVNKERTNIQQYSMVRHYHNGTFVDCGWSGCINIILVSWLTGTLNHINNDEKNICIRTIM